MRSVGNLLIALGLALAAIGLMARLGLLGWFGHLPGDVRLETDNLRVFVPITSMLLVSLVVSLLLGLLGRLRGM